MVLDGPDEARGVQIESASQYHKVKKQHKARLDRVPCGHIRMPRRFAMPYILTA